MGETLRMNQDDVELLFEYLKKILFAGGAVEAMELSQVSQECSKLVQGLNLLNKWLTENQRFSENIALGNLNCEGPSRDNPICDPLKMLRSNLSHLVWQARQVAQGDYSQKVVMLGEFSDGFNTMIEQLKQREEELVEQNNHIMDKASALLESNELMTCITENMKDFIIVQDAETKEIVFENRAFSVFARTKPIAAKYLQEQLQNYSEKVSGRFWEIVLYEEEIKSGDETLYFALHSFYIDWQGRRARAHLLNDETAHKLRESSIEHIANSDPLTGLYNRRYCMEMLEEFIEEKSAFSICYADLDGLKYVNDHYGHAVGDQYLLTVSRIFREIFRSSDIVCRIGGDEFVILLQNCPMPFLITRMKQVYDRIDALSDHNEWGIPMSISYGICSCEESNMLTAEEILEQADTKMYAFKQENKKRSR